MRIYTCDNCKKIIERRDEMLGIAVGSLFTNVEVCMKCSKPISEFLKKKNLIGDSSKLSKNLTQKKVKDTA